MTTYLFKEPLLFLAPLAGYTDSPFRQICKQWGAEVLISEMVSADGIIRDSYKTLQYAYFEEFERPFGIQIFGNDPLIMAKAASTLLPLKPDFIDLNMGCPVKKVIRRGAGSALMQTPSLAVKIVKEVKNALQDCLPLSVKFRSGWDMQNLNFLDFGILMQDSGADFLCLHPRTSRQMFSGISNWEHIKILKQNVSIPVIGNGDIKTPEDALTMLRETNCDGLMIGRGALGKPWLFSQCRELLKGGTYKPVTRQDILNTIILHIDKALQYKQEYIAVRELRAQLCFYTKGILGGPELRNKINHTDSIAELKEIILKSFPL
ncbi:MAG TPA: tRNA dihydrouridine synthase DusB [Candidatus Cloacimonas sp.]|nr:tRNA dihydrouridine synthase DusB [Candidatus Cloacimonas sp.]